MIRWIALLAFLPVVAAAQQPTLELEDCRISAGPAFPGINAKCAEMTRPENPDDPDGATITLKVAVVPALDLDPMPDPVVPIAGGPGQGSISMYAQQRRAFEPLRRNRDILLIDQRGTGESSTMGCPVDEDVVEGVFSTEETTRLSAECLEQLPHDPRYFTTSVAVRDIDAVREALGYPALNLYGVSYGSRVAQHYARRFPETTRTVIIDGVIPPDLPLGPDIAIESQKALDSVIDRCTEEPACAAAFPDLADTFDVLLADLEANPRQVTVLNPISGSPEEITFGTVQMGAALRLMLYSPDSISMIPLMINAAANDNFTPLAASMLMVVGSLGESLSIGMHNSVMCTEDVPRYASMGFDASQLDDTYMGPMQFEALNAICAAWPEGFIDDDLHELLEVDMPVLLLSGTADPITPPDYALRSMVKLKNARHIVGVKQGHGQVAVGCMPYLLADFVEAADTAAVDDSCFQERSHVMPFLVDFTGPSP